MIMREYRPEDLEQVMAIANTAWSPIRRMSREALGNTIADILNPEGDAKSKGLQVKAQIESGKYGIAVVNTIMRWSGSSPGIFPAPWGRSATTERSEIQVSEASARPCTNMFSMYSANPGSKW